MRAWDEYGRDLTQLQVARLSKDVEEQFYGRPPVRVDDPRGSSAEAERNLAVRRRWRGRVVSLGALRGVVWDAVPMGRGRVMLSLQLADGSALVCFSDSVREVPLLPGEPPEPITHQITVRARSVADAVAEAEAHLYSDALYVLRTTDPLGPDGARSREPRTFTVFVSGCPCAKCNLPF